MLSADFDLALMYGFGSWRSIIVVHAGVIALRLRDRRSLSLRRATIAPFGQRDMLSK